MPMTLAQRVIHNRDARRCMRLIDGRRCNKGGAQPYFTAAISTVVQGDKNTYQPEWLCTSHRPKKEVMWDGTEKV